MPDNFYVPSEVFAGKPAGGFWATYMAFAHPVAADFYRPEFAAFLKRIGHPFQLHRKLWEYAFVEHRLETAGVLRPGTRGLGFGVGQEKLPALFAKAGCTVVATDAPADVGAAWSGSKEFSAGAASLNRDGILDDAQFFARVSHEVCDMNAISPHMRDFDFCWSACCLEHLGSLEAGLRFILNSLQTLKIGGVAVHTTEFNLSSSTRTVETGPTVLYRSCDLEEFVRRVRALGHEIDDIEMGPLITPVDHHVDVPPFTHNPHLKLLVGEYVATSVGLVLRRRH